MQNLTYLLAEVTETNATERIMDACRANPDRRSVYLDDFACAVSFTLLADGTHEACLRHQNGVVIALANVDEFDI